MAYSEAEYEAMDSFESESEASWEARPGPRRPSSAPSFKPRPAPGAPAYVTQTQLQAALVRVDGKIKTISDGVTTVDRRVAALAAAVKKEAEERKKSENTQGKDLNQKVQLLALMPLLLQPTSGTLAGATVTLPDGTSSTSVVVPSTNSLNAVLPILLVSGLGGSGGSGGLGGLLGGDGGDGGLLLLALALAFFNK